MSTIDTVMTYVGGAISLGGVLITAGFMGYRTYDPFAETMLGPLPLAVELVGIVLGLVVAFAGTVIASRFGDETRVDAVLTGDEE